MAVVELIARTRDKMANGAIIRLPVNFQKKTLSARGRSGSSCDTRNHRCARLMLQLSPRHHAEGDPTHFLAEITRPKARPRLIMYARTTSQPSARYFAAAAGARRRASLWRPERRSTLRAFAASSNSHLPPANWPDVPKSSQREIANAHAALSPAYPAQRATRVRQRRGHNIQRSQARRDGRARARSLLHRAHKC